MKSFMRFTMAVAVIAVLTAACVMIPAASEMSHAADALVLDEGSGTVITGEISELQHDTFVLVSDGKKMTVDLSKIDMQDSANKLLSNGMHVSVEGQIDDNRISASRITKLSNSDTPATP